MFTKTFWKQALERALKSAAQSLVILWGVDQFSAFSVDWGYAGGIALGAAVLSLLTSMVSLPAGDTGSPSLVKGSAE